MCTLPADLPPLPEAFRPAGGYTEVMTAVSDPGFRTREIQVENQGITVFSDLIQFLDERYGNDAQQRVGLVS
jgi:hypothetical protein